MNSLFENYSKNPPTSLFGQIDSLPPHGSRLNGCKITGEPDKQITGEILPDDALAWSNFGFEQWHTHPLSRNGASQLGEEEDPGNHPMPRAERSSRPADG